MGKTILISSHILHELAQLCTRIGIIEAGEWVAEGSLDEIFNELDLQRVVHVQVTNPDAALYGKVTALPGVKQVEEDPDRWSIHVDESLTSIEDLHDAIHGLGARIRMFQPQAMDMETVFMKLTEGKTA